MKVHETTSVCTNPKGNQGTAAGTSKRQLPMSLIVQMGQKHKTKRSKDSNLPDTALLTADIMLINVVPIGVQTNLSYPDMAHLSLFLFPRLPTPSWGNQPFLRLVFTPL